MANIFDLFKKIEKSSDSSPITHIIAGLGNVGPEYVKTRHNIGFMAIDYIADRLGVKIDRAKFDSLIVHTQIGDVGVLLMKPQTFMNLSGESIKEIATWYKIPCEKIMVIYDDTSMPTGSIRIREKGSAGGHNGMKSIIQHLSTDVFPRLKIGINAKPDGYDLADYVLGKFTKDEQKIMFETFEKVNLAINEFIARGVNNAMNKFNFTRSQ